MNQTGPMRHTAGHDVNYLSHAGLLDLIGEKDRAPAIPGIPVADLVGGGMNGALGILLALFHRQRDGQGQHIDISITDGTLGLLPTVQFFQALYGTAQNRGETFLSHRYACYNTYETADGRFLSVGAVESRFWQNLLSHTLAADARARSNGGVRRATNSKSRTASPNPLWVCSSPVTIGRRVRRA